MNKIGPNSHILSLSLYVLLLNFSSLVDILSQHGLDYVRALTRILFSGKALMRIYIYLFCAVLCCAERCVYKSIHKMWYRSIMLCAISESFGLITTVTMTVDTDHVCAMCAYKYSMWVCAGVCGCSGARARMCVLSFSYILMPKTIFASQLICIRMLKTSGTNDRFSSFSPWTRQIFPFRQ